MQRNAAEVLLRDCFGHRDRESLLVVAEPECAPLAERIAGAARDRGYPAALLVIPTRHDGSEPPDFVAEALRAANIALLLTARPLSGTKAFRTLRDAGLRGAEIAGFSPEEFMRLLNAPSADISSSATALSGAIEPGSRVRIRGAGGTDLEFVAGAEREVRDGVIRERGEFGALPAGFVRFEVEPGSLKGDLRVDAWPPQSGDGKLTLSFARGVLGSVSHPEFRHILQDGTRVESVGFGLNSAARVGRSSAESLLATGAAFVRLAKPGGRGEAPMDLVFSSPSVEVDGVPIPRGVLSPPAPQDYMPEPMAAQPAAARADIGPEIFRTIFENSNEPQYAVDFESQSIALVNDAWLRLMGYSRSQIAAGRLRVEDIIAEESKDRVAEKRAQRKSVPNERYELRVKTAAGDKKPVEVSVQRLKIQGRDMIIGTMRDLTTQEKMKKDLTERATDAMRKTLEIYALTEKIKNVPKLTPALLSGANEEEVLARASKILTQKPGLSYASASVYLIDGTTLVQRFPVPTAKSGPSRFDMNKGHRLARIARGEESEVDWSSSSIAIPLPGREGVIGVLDVSLDAKETQVLVGQGGHTVRAEYQNLLLSVAQIIGLALENLRLYNVVKEQSEIDQLTSVYNRRMFDRRLAEEVKRARRYSRDLALLMIDLDHFKEVNDSFGHQDGDETLRQVAQFLRVQSRNVDILSRYGGDEFCLLLPECNLDNALQKAELLRKRFVTRKFSTVGRGSKTVRLTLSIGVGALGEEMSTEYELVKIADSALYRAKGLGRNRVCGPEAQATR
ncbi:MAG: GAF sensor-containing diguanylate [Planctomycetota bacterium]|nr:MAG: GAF sensor-containing diguanylate [Planctomycetota bacterium]